MADEEVKPVEEQVTETPPAEEAKQEELPLAAATEETAEAEQPAETAAEPEPVEPVVEEPKPDWKEKELKAKHRQLQDAKRRESEMQAKIEALEALAAKFNQTTQSEPAVVPLDEVDRRAKEILAQQQYVENLQQGRAGRRTKLQGRLENSS